MTTGLVVLIGAIGVRAIALRGQRRSRAERLLGHGIVVNLSLSPRQWTRATWASVIQWRQSGAYDAALAVGLDAIARAVRSGGSLQSGIGEAAESLAGPVGEDLRRVAATVQRGARLDAALDEWRATRDRPAVRLAVGAIALAAQTGGPPARVIEDVAASLRVRMQIEGEARSLGSQARLSALVVGVAPVGFALVACAADSRNARLMFGTPIGVACVAVGLALDVTGAVWMHRISETVLR